MGKTSFVYNLIVVSLSVIVFSLISVSSVSAQDDRVYRLANFLASFNSPLVYSAPDFVMYADQNGLDYRLLPAIAGVESTFGKNYIEGTYNAYGWGQGTIPFNSWSEGIAKISSKLRTEYIQKGAPSLEQIGRRYCPPNAIKWTSNVQYFMNQIENVDISTNPMSIYPKFGFKHPPLTI